MQICTAQFRTLTDLVYFRTVADLDATVIESAMNSLFIFCSSFGIIILFMIAILKKSGFGRKAMDPKESGSSTLNIMVLKT